MPKIPTVLADKASLGRPALPRDFGGGEGMEALGQAVGGIGDIAGRLFEEEMSADVSGSVAEANRALNDLSMQVQANPDHNARNKMYADGALKIAREAREGLRYPKFQGMFDERVEGSLERGRVGIAQGVRKAQVDSASANRMKSIETTFDGMANISDPIERGLERDKIYTEIQDGVRGGLWSASQGAQMQIQIDNRIAKQEMLSEAQTFADSVRDLPPAAQIAAVQAMPPGELRAKADALVHHQIDVDASLKRAAHETSTDGLYFSIESGAWPDGTPVTRESVLKKADDAGLGIEETPALLARIPTVTREARAAEFKARSKELREHYEEMVVLDPEQFYAMDLYERPPVMDEFGKQEIDGNNQPVFRPSIASMLDKGDRDALKLLKTDGPAGRVTAQDKHVIAARNEYLLAINPLWVRYAKSPWSYSLGGNEGRAQRSQAIALFDDAVTHKMGAEKRRWLYPLELREISRKLLTPAVLDTGASGLFGGAFNSEEKVLPWELTPKYLDEQMGSMEDIKTYSLEAAAAEVEQMPEAVAADIRQRMTGAGILPDGDDVEFLRGMLQIRRHDLDEISQGITR
jgi:hypothetical protein